MRFTVSDISRIEDCCRSASCKSSRVVSIETADNSTVPSWAHYLSPLRLPEARVLATQRWTLERCSPHERRHYTVFYVGTGDAYFHSVLPADFRTAVDCLRSYVSNAWPF